MKSEIFEHIHNPIKAFARQIIGSCRDVAPIR